jgi:hypothetical protein
MTKTHIYRPNEHTIPVEELKQGDMFTQNGSLYVKTWWLSSRCDTSDFNAINVVTGSRVLFGKSEPVTHHPHITITIKG